MLLSSLSFPELLAASVLLSGLAFLDLPLDLPLPLALSGAGPLSSAADHDEALGLRFLLPQGLPGFPVTAADAVICMAAGVVLPWAVWRLSI